MIPANFARILRSLAGTAAVALSLASCATHYAKLSEKTPPFQPPAGSGGALAREIDLLHSTLRVENKMPLDAIGRYLDVANAASTALKRNPGDANALAAYNYALSRAFGVLYSVRQNPWAEQIKFPGMAGDWHISAKPDRRPAWQPSLYKFQPADELEVTGKYVASRSSKPGLGAPLIATRRDDSIIKNDRFAQGAHVYYGVTAIAHFKGNHCEVAFEDPLATETIAFQGRRFPLAADYTAPLAVALASEDTKGLELPRLINPNKFANTARLARLQPYDPDKIPILCVHGLKDSPATWVPLINALRADPEIRDRYQLWYFTYPSGYPYPYSAALLRRQMDAIAQYHAGHKKVVLIGHSMGGVISRSMITDSGEKIWQELIGKPPEQIRMSSDSLEVLQEALVFDHRKDVGRVIFIAAPHRGSDLASNWVGRLGSRLVRAPTSLLNMAGTLTDVLTLDPSVMHLRRLPNSVDTLSPKNRFVLAINKIPITPGIPYHSIMGDRGRGDTPDSSDGVVPYWSSHLDGAESELIVPSNHSAHQNPQAIEEVKRILRKHARR